MANTTKEQKDKIIKVLTERGAMLPCPRCGHRDFTLLDGYFNQVIQEVPEGIVLGGRTIPSVVVACNRCGYLSQHALGMLGLLAKEENKPVEEVKK
jgi:predicted nucleic-acid-binding Zn-ribbon protein